VLGDWHRRQDATDIAIELPTGAGKTLVGGLIADFRRRAHRERVAIACPTRQLARQTATRLREYGIPNVLLVGRVADWSGADRALYTRAEAVAVTVYSHVFNSNPAINDAQLLVFDDAHAAEQAVINPWAVSVERALPLYHEIITTLADALDPLVVDRLRAEDPDPRQRALTYLISPNGVAAQGAALEEVLQAAVASKTGPDNLPYALTNTQGHIGRALIYASHRSILIRPLIPPTSTLPAFAGPRQRLYMSATLGHGGELERAFGRRAIHRIPVPRGWDRQGSGRRFFVLPALTTDLREPQEIDAWVRDLADSTGRGLILATSEHHAKDLVTRLVPDGASVLRADDVEDDLAVFTVQPKAALVLANRYDGIDLPDDDCRLVVLAGLPARGDLQERFLHDSLGAIEVLRERMRARFAQGAGRATRNVKDYAAVVLLGDELINYVGKREVAAALHPELQAELEWGFEESQANSGAELRGDLGEFFAQTANWQDANRGIIEKRSGVEVGTPPGTEALAAAAPHEVQAWAAAWQGDWERAVNSGRSVIDALSGGRDVQRYAALWHYILASWVTQLPQTPAATVRDYLNKARAAGRGTTWLDHLVAPTDDPDVAEGAAAKDDLDVYVGGQILANIPSIGRNARFEQDITQARSGLLGRDAQPYEEALVYMGTLAGAVSDGNGGAHAAPDAMWRFGDLQWISWEAKSEAEPGGELSVIDTRQAGSHLRYMQTNYSATAPRSSYGLILTPQARVHPSAVAVAESHLYRTRPTTVVDVFDRLVAAWRQVRAMGAGLTADIAYDVLKAQGALPSQWAVLLKCDRVVPLDD
jgi:hypothetical protein